MARTPGVADAMGFAVPKDVENHPVRELDRGRQREMRWWLLAVGLAVGGLLLLVWQQEQWTNLGYQESRLQKALAAEDVTHRYLSLRMAQLTAPQRVREIAVKDLGMVMPALTEAVILTRVRQAAVPEKTLVARR